MEVIETIETKVSELGIFGKISDMSLTREFEPFNEDSTSVSFAELINSGELTFEDAYRWFWSCPETPSIWGISDESSHEYRVTIPAWRNAIGPIINSLQQNVLNDAVQVLSRDYFRASGYLADKTYNPFTHDLFLALRAASRCDDEESGLRQRIFHEFDGKDLMKYLHHVTLDDPAFDDYLIYILESNPKYKDLIYGMHLFSEEDPIALLGKHKSTKAAPVLASMLSSGGDYQLNQRLVYAIAEIREEESLKKAEQFVIRSIENEISRKKVSLAEEIKAYEVTKYRGMIGLIHRCFCRNRPEVSADIWRPNDKTEEKIKYLGSIRRLESVSYLWGLHKDIKSKRILIEGRDQYQRHKILTNIATTIIEQGNDSERREIYDGLKSKDCKEVRCTLDAMLHAPRSDAFDLLADYLDSDKDDCKDAASILAIIDKDKAMPILLKYAKNETSRYRIYVLDTIKGFYPQEAGEIAGEMIGSFVKSHGRARLTKNGKNELEWLIHICWDSMEERYLPEIISGYRMLSQGYKIYTHGPGFPVEGSIDFLMSQLKDPSDQIRALAIWMLSYSITPPGQEIRDIAVNDRSELVRASAASYLGKFPSQENSAAIVNMTEESLKKKRFLICEIPKLARSGISTLLECDYQQASIIINRIVRKDIRYLENALGEFRYAGRGIADDPGLREFAERLIEEDIYYFVNEPSLLQIKFAMGDTARLSLEIYQKIGALPISKRIFRERISSRRRILIRNLEDPNHEYEDRLLKMYHDTDAPEEKKDIAYCLAKNCTSRNLSALLAIGKESGSDHDLVHGIARISTRELIIEEGINLNEYFPSGNIRLIHEAILPKGHFSPEITHLRPYKDAAA